MNMSNMDDDNDDVNSSFCFGASSFGEKQDDACTGNGGSF